MQGHGSLLMLSQVHLQRRLLLRGAFVQPRPLVSSWSRGHAAGPPAVFGVGWLLKAKPPQPKNQGEPFLAAPEGHPVPWPCSLLAFLAFEW